MTDAAIEFPPVEFPVVEPPLARAQPLLFAELPETGADARAARRARAAARQRAAMMAMATLQQPAFAAEPPAPPVVSPAVFEPAALSNAELRALLEALPDHRLAFLLLEAARELKRRVLSPASSDSETLNEPNPALIRAAVQAAGELSGEDDCAVAAVAPAGSRNPPRDTAMNGRARRPAR